MAHQLSKSQVDQLGERIKGGEISEADLGLLDAYRHSFAQAYEYVVGRIRDDLNLEPTGRPTKSTTSITYKLARESIRLSQMQDIAGCRIIVPDIIIQDVVVGRLTEIFGTRSVFDRREAPNSGYRAVHVVVRYLERPIEVQVRTALQHVWAELSEKLSDVVSPAVKYGDGPTDLMDVLLQASNIGAKVERHEKQVFALEQRERLREATSFEQDNIGLEISNLEASVFEAKRGLAEMLKRMIGEAHIWRDD